MGLPPSPRIHYNKRMKISYWKHYCDDGGINQGQFQEVIKYPPYRSMSWTITSALINPSPSFVTTADVAVFRWFCERYCRRHCNLYTSNSHYRVGTYLLQHGAIFLLSKALACWQMQQGQIEYCVQDAIIYISIVPSSLDRSQMARMFLVLSDCTIWRPFHQIFKLKTCNNHSHTICSHKAKTSTLEIKIYILWPILNGCNGWCKHNPS